MPTRKKRKRKELFEKKKTRKEKRRCRKRSDVARRNAVVNPVNDYLLFLVEFLLLSSLLCLIERNLIEQIIKSGRKEEKGEEESRSTGQKGKEQGQKKYGGRKYLFLLVQFLLLSCLLCLIFRNQIEQKQFKKTGGKWANGN